MISWKELQIFLVQLLRSDILLSAVLLFRFCKYGFLTNWFDYILLLSMSLRVLLLLHYRCRHIHPLPGLPRQQHCILRFQSQTFTAESGSLGCHRDVNPCLSCPQTKVFFVLQEKKMTFFKLSRSVVF